MSLLPLLLSRIRAHGPMTVADFMETALYHPEHGYYMTSPRRSGRAGDYFTSVDVGPLFGEIAAVQLAEMWQILRATGTTWFDLVEAGASDGRLMRDILNAAAVHHRDLYSNLRVTLVERSAQARAVQVGTLGPHSSRVESLRERLPEQITGAILANELLDALPVHVVRMSELELRELYVGEHDGRLVLQYGPPSTPALAAELDRTRAALGPGQIAEVGLAAAEWMADAAARLVRGFLLLFDYGHEAAELYSAAHAGGTLLGYRHHVADAADWLARPGECDMTAHVNLTSLRLAAEAAGLTSLEAVDQTYFMLALGVMDRLGTGSDAASVTRRLAARTLVMPGGLGSTMKAIAFGRHVGSPALRGFSSGRVT